MTHRDDPRMLRTGVAAAALLLIVLAACSGDGPADASETTAAEASPTPAAPTEGDGASATDSTDDDGAVDPWRRTAVEHRGMDGEQFDYDCPAGGEPATIWGTDVYTDDSSVCTAAVHAGAITVDDGGTITIEIAPGEDEYAASERNGIESSPYGPWGGSFVVVDE